MYLNSKNLFKRLLSARAFFTGETALATFLLNFRTCSLVLIVLNEEEELLIEEAETGGRCFWSRNVGLL